MNTLHNIRQFYWYLGHKRKDLDLHFSHLIQTYNHPWLILFMKIITNLASPLVVIVELIAVLTFSMISKQYQEESLLLVLSTLSVLAGTVGKIWLEKPRPDDKEVKIYVEEKSYNFPSTHACIAISLFGFASYLCFIYNFFIAAWILLILALIICFSRIYLGVHFLSDVLGGMYLGTTILLLLVWLYGKIPEDIINTKHVAGILVLGALCLLIYYRKNIKIFLKNKSEREKRLVIGTSLGLIVILMIHFSGLSFLLLIVTIWILGMKEIWKISKNKKILIISYLIFTVLATNAIFLRVCLQGEFLVYLALISAWTTDTIAYFVGKKWGRIKIFPKLSPGKTLQGTAGGIIACVIFINLIFYQEILLGRWQIFLFSILLSLSAILGDLLESWFKRLNQIKESDDILPGHGGFLDRIDSSFVNMWTMSILNILNI